MLLYITWDVSRELFNIGGMFPITYYGLFFALAFWCGLKVEERMFRVEGLKQEWLDKLLIYVAIATVLGARAGHCLFYEWEYFSRAPWEIFLPFSFNPFEFTGFRGLASHGAAIGILIGLWIYSRKVTKKSIFWILDRVVLPVALAAMFIRLGNLMNSEIVGLPTDMPWGFKFIHASGVMNTHLPRHPAQLYEAVCYLFSFVILMYLYWKTNAKEKQGFLFGLFLVLIFTARFFIEFLKESQEAFEDSMTLDMGQWLSIPFILAGAFMLWYSNKKYKEKRNNKV